MTRFFLRFAYAHPEKLRESVYVNDVLAATTLQLPSDAPEVESLADASAVRDYLRGRPDAKRCVERIPRHPTRAAYAHEMNCWWEECSCVQYRDAVAQGFTVRVA